MTDAELIAAGLLSDQDPDRHMHFADGQWRPNGVVVLDENDHIIEET